MFTMSRTLPAPLGNYPVEAFKGCGGAVDVVCVCVFDLDFVSSYCIRNDSV